jgi:PTS system nitrogen regulatory IIA component
MKRSLKKVAGALDLPVSTLQRWIRQGRIPVQRNGAEVVFSPVALEKWAVTHHLPFNMADSRTDDTVPEVLDSLVSAMQRGKVHYGLAGDDSGAALRSAVDRIDLLPADIRQELFDKLIERERLASTGIGNGIAIPHPRDPLSIPPETPVIATCFPAKPVQFNAIDDQPVFVLFLLISPSVKLHLHLLSRLSYCIRDRSFVDFLNTQPDAEALYARVAVFETKLDDL